MNKLINASFSGISVKVAIFVPHGKGDSIHKDRPFHGFAYFQNGARIYKFEKFGTIETGENEIIYMPKGSNYTVETPNFTPDAGCYAINFDVENDLDIPPFKISPKNPNETLLAFRSAENAWRTKFPGYFEKASEKLYRIIGQMKAEMTAEYMPNEKTALIAPAVSYINENYTSEAISISHLSELCGVSEVYFRKIFKNVYGSSPLKYINSLKLSRARDLIHSGLYSVKDAAFMSGFFDDSYFSREFKKEFGVSPKDFR